MIAIDVKERGQLQFLRGGGLAPVSSEQIALEAANKAREIADALSKAAKRAREIADDKFVAARNAVANAVANALVKRKEEKSANDALDRAIINVKNAGDYVSKSILSAIQSQKALEMQLSQSINSGVQSQQTLGMQLSQSILSAIQPQQTVGSVISQTVAVKR